LKLKPQAQNIPFRGTNISYRTWGKEIHRLQKHPAGMGYVIVPQEGAYQIDQHTVGGKKPAPIEVLVYSIICLQGFVHLGPGSLPSTVAFHWQEF